MLLLAMGSTSCSTFGRVAPDGGPVRRCPRLRHRFERAQRFLSRVRDRDSAVTSGTPGGGRCVLFVPGDRRVTEDVLGLRSGKDRQDLVAVPLPFGRTTAGDLRQARDVV